MINTLEALQAWKKDEYGYQLDLGGGIEVRLEQLIFDKQWYLAVYKDEGLVAPKVVVRIGKE